MNQRHPNADAEIVIHSDKAKKRLSAADRKKIKRLIMDRLLLTSLVPYSKVQVELRRRSDGAPESLIVAMLRALSYTADFVKVNVDEKLDAKSFESLSGRDLNS